MNKLKKFVPLLLLMNVATQNITAQYDQSDDLYFDNKITYEMGGSFGVMNCLTDLGGHEGIGKNFLKDLNLRNTQFAGTIYLSASYRYAITLRTEATWGNIKASDDVLIDVKETTPGRYSRNLSFRSSIFDFALITEIHPRYFKRYDKNDKLPRFSPYLLAGIGMFAFNPQAKLNDRWVDLQPLKTEGQGFAEYPDRKEYKLKQVHFPVGAGLKYKLSSTLNFSTEVVYRILNTDYLDDVSTRYIDQKLFYNYLSGEQLADAVLLSDRQGEINPSHLPQKDGVRGNPKNNDAYFSLNFKLGYIF